MASEDPGDPGAGAEGGPAEPRVLEPTQDAGSGVVRRSGGRLRWIAAFVGAVALIAGLVVIAGRDDKPDAKAALKAAQHLVATSDSYRFELHDVSHAATGDPGGAGTDTTTRDVTTANVAAADRWHVIETTSDSADESFGFSTGPTELIRIGDEGWTRGGDFGPGDSSTPPWTTVRPPKEARTVDDYVEGFTRMEAAMAADPSCGGADAVAGAGSDSATTTTTVTTAADATTTTAAGPSGLPNGVCGQLFGLDDPEQMLDLAVAAYVLPVADDPANIKRVVEEAADPVVEEQLANGGVRLRTRLAPIAAMAKLVKQPLPPVDLLLDLDGENRPTVARFTAKVQRASRDVEIRYSGWDTPIQVSPPDDTQIDHTPWIAEEDLAKLDPALRLAPSVLPGDYVLTNVDVYNDSFMNDFGNDTAEPCPSLELGYGTKAEYDHAVAHADDDPATSEADPFYAELDYLSVSVSTSHCASQYQDGDITYEQVLGGHPAHIAEDEDAVYVQLGDVVVEIDTTLGYDQLDGLARSIHPVTVDELAASIPGWAKEDAPEGAYGYGWGSGPFVNL